MNLKYLRRAVEEESPYIKQYHIENLYNEGSQCYKRTSRKSTR